MVEPYAEVEVQGVEELDRRVRRVHLDIPGDVQQALAVVEDDLHAGIDEVVGDVLRGGGRHCENADDDVLVVDGVLHLRVPLHLDVAGAVADHSGSRSKTAAMLMPCSAKIGELGDRLAEPAGADECDVVLPLRPQDLADLAEQAVDGVAHPALAELPECRTGRA